MLSPTGEAEGSAAKDGPFRVVFAAPKGEAADVAELGLVFSRPLRALELAGDAPPPPFHISPALAGQWQWVGTQALRFVPEKSRLPAATSFSVVVPESLQALDGSRLQQAYRFDFTTPRPKLVETNPYAGQEGLVPSTTFSLLFNQPIDPAAFQRMARLGAERAGRRQELKFRAQRPDPSEPKRIELRPEAPLPIHSAIALDVSAELKGEEGPLPAGQPANLRYRTYGPLAVTGVHCDRETPHRRCRPGGSISLSLSNPVKFGELKRLVSVAPAIPLQWQSWQDASSFTSSIDLVGAFQAGKSYTVRVQPELTDRFGQALGKPFSETVLIDDFFPRVEIGVQGSALVTSGPRSIPIASVNVPRFELFAAELDAEKLLVALEGGSNENPLDVFEKLRGSSRRTITPNVATNVLAKISLDVGEVLGGAQERGPFAIGVRYRSSPQDYSGPEPVKLVKLTDLGLTAKLSRSGTLVWVTRLSSSELVSGAEISILQKGRPRQNYRTDSRGIAHIPAADFAPNPYASNEEAVIVARAGTDFTFETVNSFVSPWRLKVPVDYSGRDSAYGLIFTDRGIYRPGDSVEVKGILRKPGRFANALPSAARVELVLHAPDNEAIFKGRAALSKFGTFESTLKVPASARLGSFRVEALLPGEEPIAEYFEVAEYRPAEFQVEVQSDRPWFVRGDEARFSIAADYLFGAPMAGAAVHYSATRAESHYSVPNSDGFVTDAATYRADLDEESLDTRELLSHDEKLDGSGRLGFARKLDLPAQHGPEVVTVDAEVTDLSRQSIAASSTAFVHPAEFYVGIRQPSDYFLSVPAKFSPKVVAFSAQGERLAGKKLSVELISRRWSLAHEDRDGGTRSVSKVVDRVVGKCELVTQKEPVSCPLELREAGYYVLHVHGKDGRGNRAAAALGVYALGEGSASFGDNDRRELTLVTNKKQYQLGDTAKILVKSPFTEAEALVTVERAGVLRSERVRLRGPTPTVDLKVTDEFRPNAFVGVHLLKVPGKKAGVGPEYRMGYAEIRVDPEARRLKVAVKPSRRDLGPGDELVVDLELRDRDGKPALGEVTLYAVDEGVLSLIGYKTPDPLPVFTGPRGLAVATVETRESLAKLVFSAIEGSQDKGGHGGGGGPMGTRRDFRQTAYFNPKLVTDDRGRVSARFKLPESLTTYRVMAVAVGADDRYGFGQSSVTTSKRLMARPALPRFLRAGDRLDASLLVSAKGFGPEKVTVSASSKGGLILDGPAAQTIDLGKDETREVRFAGRADRAGSMALRFEVRGGKERDAVEVERKIASPAALETVALYGSATAPAAEKLGDLKELRSDVGGLEVSLASSALVGLDTGLTQLFEYPYGCTEQLASRLMPLLPLSDLARDFKVELPKNSRLVVERTVAEILSRQRGDGGFGMWPESRESSSWVAPYAIWTLHQAQSRGISVPKLALQRAKDYLRRELSRIQWEHGLSLASAAFIVDVLAEIGTPDPGYMGRLFEAREKLPLFSKAQLLHAFAVSKLSPPSADRLLAEIEGQLRITGNTAAAAENTGDEYAVLMDSTVRTSALVLRALLAQKKDHPLGDELARGLLLVRRGGAWRTTQENAFALLALDAYRKAQEASAPDFSSRVWLNQTELLSAQFRGHTLATARTAVPSDRLGPLSGAVLAFERSGSGTLFYEARLRYAKRTLPSTPLDRGFFVQKSLRSVKPADLESALRSSAASGQTQFKAGDLVLADLLVVTPSPRDFVVVDDPLPAGFEAIDSGLVTTASWLKIPSTGSDVSYDDDGRDALAHGRARLWSEPRRELRDDRALFFVDHMAAGIHHYRYLARATGVGSFVVPPTRAEEMYMPENFGRTAAVQLVVR